LKLSEKFRALLDKIGPRPQRMQDAIDAHNATAQAAMRRRYVSPAERDAMAYRQKMREDIAIELFVREITGATPVPDVHFAQAARLAVQAADELTKALGL